MTISGAPNRKTSSPSSGRILQTAFSLSVLLATIFTSFSPHILSGSLAQTVESLMTPQSAISQPLTVTSGPIRIGIVSGHWGNDTGAVCSNGVTEQEVNYSIAVLVVQKLQALGYTVDLLQEFDPRLTGYKAAALVSIHNDTCDDLGPDATGFKVAGAIGNHDPNLAARLVDCLSSRYGATTGLPFLAGQVTDDMTQYHAYYEIDPSTTAAIIEAGFLRDDYNLLTQKTSLVADGIASGILCFVRNENIQPTSTP
jgi:N-acetylmuramoyl-L-alanine amidase